jgi:hypothetical protein
MAQAIQKITRSAGCDISFNKLVLSQQNVRKTKADVSIEDLGEDIARRGLLSSHNVCAELDGDCNETGTYRVPAGGRRYHARELLVSQKRLSQTDGGPCVVSRGEAPEVEDSLAANVHRVDLHPLDQFRAFQTLHEQGQDEDDISARFFISVATMLPPGSFVSEDCTMNNLAQHSRSVSIGFKLDISRGERIGRMSSEWFSELDDERYLSLGKLYDWVKSRADHAHDGSSIIGLVGERTLRRMSVMDKCRVELVGFTYGMRDWPRSTSLFSEMIAWKVRFFVTTTEEGPVILERSKKRHRLIDSARRS